MATDLDAAADKIAEAVFATIERDRACIKQNLAAAVRPLIAELVLDRTLSPEAAVVAAPAKITALQQAMQAFKAREREIQQQKEAERSHNYWFDPVIPLNPPSKAAVEMAKFCQRVNKELTKTMGIADLG